MIDHDHDHDLLKTTTLRGYLNLLLLMFLQHQSSLFRGRYYNGQYLLLKFSQKVILSLNLQTVCLVLSSSIHLLFLLFSGLTPTCSLNSLPDEVILQIFSSVSLHQVLCTVKHKSAKISTG